MKFWLYLQCLSLCLGFVICSVNVSEREGREGKEGGRKGERGTFIRASPRPKVHANNKRSESSFPPSHTSLTHLWEVRSNSCPWQSWGRTLPWVTGSCPGGCFHLSYRDWQGTSTAFHSVGQHTSSSFSAKSLWVFLISLASHYFLIFKTGLERSTSSKQFFFKKQ